MKPPERFTTQRLTLRRPVLQDADAIFSAYAQDRAVTQYLTWRPHRTIEESRAFVEGRIADWETGTDFTWSILLDGVELIGGIALRVREFKADVGYVLARDHWGHGYAAEALDVVVKWALGQPAIHRVWAVCDIDNPSSARVMEKVGMTREGTLRRWVVHPQTGDSPRDCLCYSIIKERRSEPSSGANAASPRRSL